MTMSTAPAPPPTVRGTMGREQKGWLEQVTLALFILIPLVAVGAAIPVMWGWGLHWRDLVIAGVLYVITGFGITVGYHRFFTHGSFKANRGLKIALGVMGSLAVMGPLVRWVADHRKHHQFSDKNDDPHSPWAFGAGPWNMIRGLWHAHIGWLFDTEQTEQSKYAPDLLADRDIVKVSRHFPTFVALSTLGPALIGGLWSWSWEGALSAFFWASLVRVALLHHVTWSINSICHVVGRRPFRSRDKSGNVWWLSVLSFGESWHNLHHADPTSARHGVLRGQFDSSARLIWLFEKFGWASNVRWPTPERLASRRVERAGS